MDKIAKKVAERVQAEALATRVAQRSNLAAWENLPEGWTSKSLQKMWDSLSGKATKHKVSACIRHMEGQVDDPGAFCASLADKVEGKEWRSK